MTPRRGAGAVVLVLVVAALAGGGQTVGAATSAGTTLTLEKTSIDKTGSAGRGARRSG